MKQNYEQTWIACNSSCGQRTQGQEEKENSVLITVLGGVHFVHITILCQLYVSKSVWGLNKEMAKLLLDNVKEENVNRKGKFFLS